MNEATQRLCALASELLSSGRVDVVLGFERGSLPLRSRPLHARTPTEAGRLVLDGFSESNLARFLCNLAGKRVGIVARGCEARSLTVLLQEHQIEREQVIIIAVPCVGIIDRRRIEAETPATVLAAAEVEDEILLRTHTDEIRLPRQEYLCRACQACDAPAPQGDFTLGEPLAHTPNCNLADGAGAQSPAERWAAFATETARCIRCYACREACPLCYCPECFVDHSQPHWAPGGVEPKGVQFWHIIRAYHQAGRCARCGACERACPMGISLVHLTDKLNHIVEDLFGPGAGLELDAQARGVAKEEQG